MSATTAGALKSFLESQGLGVPAYRLNAPENQAPPYLTIQEAVSVVPHPDDNPWWDEAESIVVEEAQVDVWQKRKNDDNTVAESYTLPASVARALHGGLLGTAAPTKVWGMSLVDGPRLLPDPDQNIVHHICTVRILRHL